MVATATPPITIPAIAPPDSEELFGATTTVVGDDVGREVDVGDDIDVVGLKPSTGRGSPGDN